MKLRNQLFERPMRKRIREALQSSEQLRKEHRHARKIRRQNLHTRPWMARLFFLTITGFPLVLKLRSIEEVIALIVLWQLASIFLRASLLNATLYFSPALGVFKNLPISDEAIFKAQWRTFLRGSLWSALDFSLLYYVLAAKTGGGIYSIFTAIALGTVEWCFIVAFAVCLVMIGIRTFFYHLSLVFALSAFGLLFFFPNKQAIAEWIALPAYWVPPVGWLIHAMGITPSKGVLLDFLPCMLSAIVLMIFPIAYNRLRQRYSLNENVLTQASRINSSPMAGVPEYPEVAANFTEQASEAVARIKEGELRAGLDWSRLGPVERFVARMLTERERTITDYLLAGNPAWTAGFRGFAILLVVLLAGVWLLSALPGVSRIMLFFCAFLVLGAFAGKWRGFASPQGAGLQSPFYSLYPIDIWELLRLLLKVNLLRFVFYLPLVLGAGFLLLSRLSPGWSITTLMVFKFLIIGLSSHPFLAIAQISPGTNDGQKPRIVLAALFFLIVIVTSVITMFLSTTLAVVIIAGIVLAAFSYGTLLTYGSFYNNNRFDLVPAQLQTGSPH